MNTVCSTVVVLAAVVAVCFASAFTAAERQAIVDAHNYARNRIPVDFPEYAGDSCLEPVEWDCFIEEVAQNYASRCPHEYSGGRRYSDGSIMGENIAWHDTVSPVNYSVLDWYSEVSNYDPAKGGFQQNTCHYTEVVWNVTRRIGCGIVHNCSEWKTVMVCNYWPAGNYIGQSPWTPGQNPVSSCSVHANSRMKCDSSSSSDEESSSSKSNEGSPSLGFAVHPSMILCVVIALFCLIF